MVVIDGLKSGLGSGTRHFFANDVINDNSSVWARHLEFEYSTHIQTAMKQSGLAVDLIIAVDPNLERIQFAFSNISPICPRFPHSLPKCCCEDFYEPKNATEPKFCRSFQCIFSAETCYRFVSHCTMHTMLAKICKIPGPHRTVAMSTTISNLSTFLSRYIFRHSNPPSLISRAFSHTRYAFTYVQTCALLTP